MIEDALRALEPELGPAETAPVPLAGGRTNRNYRVRFAGRDCVVRLPGKDTGLLGIDRGAERAASVAAAALGIGPEVIAFEPERECLVTGFIEARPVGADELRERVAEVGAAADAIAAVMHGDPVPCHNDLLNANFLDDGRRLRILDWEYAGMGDRFFDLANFASHHDLGPDEEAALVAAYFGESTPARLAAVRLMRLMAAFWEGMWGVVQATCSELDFDFMGYADEHLAKVRTSLADPGFGDWLEDARGA